MLKISLETLLDRAVPYKINYFFSCLYILLRFFCALYCFFADDCARYLVHSQILLAYRTIVLASKSVKLLRLELYGNDIYTSLQAKIRPYRLNQLKLFFLLL